MKFSHLFAITSLASVLCSLNANAGDTATINCLSQNGGITFDAQNYMILTQGETIQFEVQSGGSNIELWSCGWYGLPVTAPDSCRWISYTAFPGSVWNILNLCDHRIVLQEETDCNYVLDLVCPPSEDPLSFIDGLTVQINGYTGSSTCPPVASVYWDWGDGTNEYAWFPGAHTFPLIGDYEVCSASFNSNQDILSIDTCVLHVEPEILAVCSGFEPPMTAHPVSAKKNRVFPLKMKMYDADGHELSDDHLVVPPVVQVIFDPAGGGGSMDVSDNVLSSGRGTDGNQFVFAETGMWQFNLGTKKYTAPGIYEVTVLSGDESEYHIDPSCVTSFVIE